jgi:hypothetical protein
VPMAAVLRGSRVGSSGSENVLMIHTRVRSPPAFCALALLECGRLSSLHKRMRLVESTLKVFPAYWSPRLFRWHAGLPSRSRVGDRSTRRRWSASRAFVIPRRARGRGSARIGCSEE